VDVRPQARAWDKNRYRQYQPPLGGHPSERPDDLAAVLTGSLALRTAGEGRRVGAIAHEDEIDQGPEGG